MSNDLRVDAERDLRDIGAGKIEVYPLNKVRYTSGELFALFVILYTVLFSFIAEMRILLSFFVFF